MDGDLRGVLGLYRLLEQTTDRTDHRPQTADQLDRTDHRPQTGYNRPVSNSTAECPWQAGAGRFPRCDGTNAKVNKVKQTACEVDKM